MKTRRELFVQLGASFLLPSLAYSQGEPQVSLKTTVPLVLAPTTVTDQRGQLVRNLTESDFLLFDEGVAQRIHVDEQMMPVSLALAVHATVDARKALHRLRQTMSLFGPLVTGYAGEAALLAIRDDVREVVPFTSDIDKLVRAVRKMQARGAGCSFVDAVMSSVHLLTGRPLSYSPFLMEFARGPH